MTKLKEKYAWHIGALPPTIDPHSMVKHDLVRDYLGRYIQVLLSNPRIEALTISVVDGFAGGGEYRALNGSDYVDGSPFIALQTITEAEVRLNIGRDKPRRVDAEYFFVEKERSNFEYLKACLQSRYGEERLQNRLHLYHKSFVDAVGDILVRIKARRGGERALFLLDQYAYDQVPLTLLSKIFASLAGAEVILTFNVDSLITFLSDRSQSKRKLEAIGLAKYVDWAALGDLKQDDPNWKSLIQRQLASGIIEGSGARYSTIFYITPGGSSSWTYWLVHLSNIYRARDVMMELHWALANNFSHFLEPDVFVLGHRSGSGSKLRQQHEFDLGAPFKFDTIAEARCREGLSPKIVTQIFESNGMKFETLLHSLGNNTPATARMIREALDPPVRVKDIEVVSESGIRREKGASIKPTDFIRPSAQRPLIFLK